MTSRYRCDAPSKLSYEVTNVATWSFVAFNELVIIAYLKINCVFQLWIVIYLMNRALNSWGLEPLSEKFRNFSSAFRVT